MTIIYLKGYENTPNGVERSVTDQSTSRRSTNLLPKK